MLKIVITQKFAAFKTTQNEMLFKKALLVRDRSLFTRGGGALYLGGGSLFFQCN